MPTNPVKKVRVIRREPPDLKDVENFADNFAKSIAAGDLDVYLDDIWDAVDNRLRTYFDEAPADDEQKSRALRISRLRKGPETVSVGAKYGIHGDSYEGVRVVVVGFAEKVEGEPHKARVRVTRGNDAYPSGSVYRIPVGALDDGGTDENPVSFYK